MIEYVIIGAGIIDVVLIIYCVWIYGGGKKMVFGRKKQPDLTQEEIEKHPRFGGGDVIRASPNITKEKENVDDVTLAIRQINEILPRVVPEGRQPSTDDVLVAAVIALVANSKKE